MKKDLKKMKVGVSFSLTYELVEKINNLVNKGVMNKSDIAQNALEKEIAFLEKS